MERWIVVMRYEINMRTLNLLKTMCHMNPRTMKYVDLAIIDLSYRVTFYIRKFDGDLEETKFTCVVGHIAHMAMLEKEKANLLVGL